MKGFQLIPCILRNFVLVQAYLSFQAQSVESGTAGNPSGFKIMGGQIFSREGRPLGHHAWTAGFLELTNWDFYLGVNSSRFRDFCHECKQGVQYVRNVRSCQKYWNFRLNVRNVSAKFAKSLIVMKISVISGLFLQL